MFNLKNKIVLKRNDVCTVYHFLVSTLTGSNIKIDFFYLLTFRYKFSESNEFRLFIKTKNYELYF